MYNTTKVIELLLDIIMITRENNKISERKKLKTPFCNFYR
jgi:hypothetical protein